MELTKQDIEIAIIATESYQRLCAKYIGTPHDSSGQFSEEMKRLIELKNKLN